MVSLVTSINLKEHVSAAFATLKAIAALAHDTNSPNADALKASLLHLRKEVDAMIKEADIETRTDSDARQD